MQLYRGKTSYIEAKTKMTQRKFLSGQLRFVCDTLAYLDKIYSYWEINGKKKALETVSHWSRSPSDSLQHLTNCFLLHKTSEDPDQFREIWKNLD